MHTYLARTSRASCALVLLIVGVISVVVVLDVVSIAHRACGSADRSRANARSVSHAVIAQVVTYDEHTHTHTHTPLPARRHAHTKVILIMLQLHHIRSKTVHALTDRWCCVTVHFERVVQVQQVR
jgi:hypothetical protein